MTITISKGGQISLPAMLRKRWGTAAVVLDDRGDHVTIRPLPADPVTAAQGVLRKPRRTAESDRTRERRESLIHEQKRG
jgi:bifunctional DNA-binding transcriptional regulator/antitoxin component of YhaV-PrlF toxin-antitoxin module